MSCEHYLKKRMVVVYEALSDRLTLVLQEQYDNNPSDHEDDDAGIDAADIIHEFLLQPPGERVFPPSILFGFLSGHSPKEREKLVQILQYMPWDFPHWYVQNWN
jgi:hypothetical protein